MSGNARALLAFIRGAVLLSLLFVVLMGSPMMDGSATLGGSMVGGIFSMLFMPLFWARLSPADWVGRLGRQPGPALRRLVVGVSKEREREQAGPHRWARRRRGDETFAGIVGTAIAWVFALEVARAAFPRRKPERPGWSAQPQR